MDKFSHSDFSQFSDLPLDKFENANYPIYVLDKEWIYLFVNKIVEANLGERGKNLVGKNIWIQFPQLATDSAFILLKNNSEKGIATNVMTTSPLTGKRLNIVSYPLKDCYFFYTSILPDKDELLNELRNAMGKKSKPQAMKSKTSTWF